MKIVKKPRKDNKQTKGNANMRTVVRKGQRRISQTETNDINAVPLSIVGTSSSSISRSSGNFRIKIQSYIKSLFIFTYRQIKVKYPELLESLIFQTIAVERYLTFLNTPGK